MQSISKHKILRNKSKSYMSRCNNYLCSPLQQFPGKGKNSKNNINTTVVHKDGSTLVGWTLETIQPLI